MMSFFIDRWLDLKPDSFVWEDLYNIETYSNGVNHESCFIRYGLIITSALVWKRWLFWTHALHGGWNWNFKKYEISCLLRFFILFGASPESGLEWSDQGIGFAYKFIKNFYYLLLEPIKPVREKHSISDQLILYNLHKTIKTVSESFDKVALRDVINHIIQFTSELRKYKEDGGQNDIFNECIEKLILLFHQT